VIGGHTGFGEAFAQSGAAGGADGALAEQHFFHHVQAEELVIRLQSGTVGDVVGVAGESVEGVHVLAQPRGDDDAHREILIPAILAGPLLDIDQRGTHDALSV